MRVAFLLLATVFLVAQSKQDLKPVSTTDAEGYLEKFGYLAASDVAALKAKKTDDELIKDPVTRQAIINFQQMAGLAVTGELDNNTKIKMAQPRCGVPDVHAYVSSSATKWGKTSLTYKIETYSPDITQQIFRNAVQEAFSIWSAVTPLKFTYVQGTNADVSIKFGRLNHGDPWPFDGKGNVLAHATLPYSDSKGMLHFDDDESWTYKDAQKLAKEDYTDILTVAVHEIGHVLGLDHSSDQNAIMSAFYKEPTDRSGRYIEPKLGTDDIRKIQNLYGKNPSSSGSSGSGSTGSGSWEPWVPWTPWYFPYPRIGRNRYGGEGLQRSSFWGNLNNMFGYY